MRLPKKWWIGLPVLAGLAYFAQQALTAPLEEDLRAAVLSRVAKSPDAIDRPDVRVAGRDVILAGISLSPDVKARLLSALGVETPARRIIDATEPLSRATPFVLRLERHGGKAVISGNVPPTGARERLRAEIAALGLEVIDGAAYADGAPQSFADLAAFAVRRLAELDPATTTITDATLAVAGEARSAADYDRALAALKAPPAGATVPIVCCTRTLAAPPDTAITSLLELPITCTVPPLRCTVTAAPAGAAQAAVAAAATRSVIVVRAIGPP